MPCGCVLEGLPPVPNPVPPPPEAGGPAWGSAALRGGSEPRPQPWNPTTLRSGRLLQDLLWLGPGRGTLRRQGGATYGGDAEGSSEVKQALSGGLAQGAFAASQRSAVGPLWDLTQVPGPGTQRISCIRRTWANSQAVTFHEEVGPAPNPPPPNAFLLSCHWAWAC